MILVQSPEMIFSVTPTSKERRLRTMRSGVPSLGRLGRLRRWRCWYQIYAVMERSGRIFDLSPLAPAVGGLVYWGGAYT